MLINGIDLSALGVQLYDRVISSNQVETTADWNPGDIQPTYVRQQDTFKNITLRFLITEKNEDDAFLTMSKLTAMLKKASIIFDDIDLVFDVTLKGTAKQERLKNGHFIYTIKLKSDYAKGGIEVYTTDTVATDYFKLKIYYYQDGNQMITIDEKIVKQSDFRDKDIQDLDDLGIDVNKYRPDYYNNGVVSGIRTLTYEELKAAQIIIINYTPVRYNKTVEYFIADESAIYQSLEQVQFSFTKKDVDTARSIGDLIDFTKGKPSGYTARTNYNEDLTFDNLMAFSPLQIYYDLVTADESKEVTLQYVKVTQNDEVNIGANTIVIKKSDIVPGSTLHKFINLNTLKPEKYYNDGYLDGIDGDAPITFEEIQHNYTIKYPLTEYAVYTEYFYGEYPSWNKITTINYKFTYDESYDSAADIYQALNIDLDKYYGETYNHGAVYNATVESFDDLINIGVLQVYYKPKDYTLNVNYYSDDDTLIESRQFTINETMFLADPPLAAIIDLNAARQEGYIFDETKSYQGAVTLGTLLANAPIAVYYKPVEQVRTKSIVIRYRKQLAEAYSTINTSIITIEEAQVGGGVRLGDLFDINAYKPEYYSDGYVNGYSLSSLFTFEELQGEYAVNYAAETYKTQVRYYTDEVANENWIGSDAIQYTVLDFETSTTLADLGLNVNAFKPSYCGDGVVQYTGPINFTALRNLDAIDIIYESQAEPEDPEGINYPHRILFLQHNDMGEFESEFPAWTLNHAYINTGVTCNDMSKLTVLVDTFRVFDTEPLYNVNVRDSYLFGSITPTGQYYIKYVNNTKYKAQADLTGVNTFNVAAGYGTPELIVEETASEGFSSNTGILASTRDGYSYGTLTYTHLVQSNSAKMLVPLYLFACNMNGYYNGGIAGVGIKSCKIYYDNELIRDFVPVAFFDKIGDKIAPSNCLYDKVSQTFFEDATGQNSFNIMDDPDVIDTDPDHNIGKCYANYYQEGTIFQSNVFYFRESDFINGKTWDPYQKLAVDYYQPQYYEGGRITNLEALGDVTFNNVNNYVFNIVYDMAGYQITVNYWKDNKTEGNLLATETLTLKESDFLSVPTIGQIIDIQKHKLANYKPVFTYNDDRVTLRRVLAHSPYDIIYEHVENPQVYTTEVRFYKKQYTIDSSIWTANWQYIDSETVSIDETEFADGVYPEKFFNLNSMYPQSGVEGVAFYAEGEPYEWYLEDENLITPADLKPVYRVVYDTVPVDIEIRYYTDEVDEDNLVATDIWSIKISDWEQGSTFQIVDELPNSYINAYKPVICWAGQLQNPETIYTFTSLVEQGHIDIVYETRVEPHNPDDLDFPQKVLWFNKVVGTNPFMILPTYGFAFGNVLPPANEESVTRNIDTPYLNLGYTPKEIGRLKTELKGYCGNAGVDGAISSYSYGGDNFAYFYGYVDPGLNLLDYYRKFGDDVKTYAGKIALINSDKALSGIYGFHGHTIGGQGLSYNDGIYQRYDGHQGYLPKDTAMSDFYNLESVREMGMYYRKGRPYITDIELEPRLIYKTYGYDWSKGYGIYPEGSGLLYQNPVGTTYSNYGWRTPEDVNSKWTTGTWADPTTTYEDHAELDTNTGHVIQSDETLYEAVWSPYVFMNPITGILDAYHDYVEMYDRDCDQNPYFDNLVNTDTDIFEYRTKPRGPLRLFVTTNPNTGEPNLLPCNSAAYLPTGGITSGAGLGTQGSYVGQNPYSQDFEGGVTVTQQVITEVKEDGTAVYSEKSITKQYIYASTKIASFPIPARCAIWGLKIWDRDRMIRDLIPVHQGDQIYDFIAPANGLFDKTTEIFFGNVNEGGAYQMPVYNDRGRWTGDWTTINITAEDVVPLHCDYDPTIFGVVTVNYYDHNNHFIDNQYVTIPVHNLESNYSLKDLVHYNDYKPNDFYRDGMIDVDNELKEFDEYATGGQTGHTPGTINDLASNEFLRKIYVDGSMNIFYKLKTFTKTVVYYRGNIRVGSRDIFYNLDDINNANTLEDLGIDVDLYASDDYKPGRIVFNESILSSDDVAAFIDAPSPIVIYDEYTKAEKPNLLYVNYYRGGAYDDSLITLSDNPNYFDCDLTGVVMNPNGIIKYLNHYHTALYEDEKPDYFIPYQVDVISKYVDIHKGPGRKYSTLATITDQGRYTVIQEMRNWGRLREYPKGWINLGYTREVVGPGQHPSYPNDPTSTVIPFKTHINITRMTIDRLWGYVPEFGAWIKLDEVSLDQTGKLYNGLGSKVIHLDEVNDWSTIDSLEDLGIYKNSYQLRFHDVTPFSYGGSYTYEDLSDAHKFDIVYPETIYAYNIIYYDRALSQTEATYVQPGRIAFKINEPNASSYSTSAYYPFSYTSPNTNGTYSGDLTCHIIPNTGTDLAVFDVVGPTVTNTSGQTFYPIRVLEDGVITPQASAYLNQKGVWYVRVANSSYASIVGQVIPAQVVTGASLTGGRTDSELGRTSFSCSLSDWNPDWPTFLATSYQYDANDDPIAPTLYRDTELTLDWEFFGVDRNAYKPDNSYDDGMFLWSPRTYEDIKHQTFTFMELIATGTQQIIYTPLVERFKIGINANIQDFVLLDEDIVFPTKAAGIYDIEIKFSNNMAFGGYANDRSSSGGTRTGYNIENGTLRVLRNTEDADHYPQYVTWISAPVFSTSRISYYDRINFSSKRNATCVRTYGVVSQPDTAYIKQQIVENNYGSYSPTYGTGVDYQVTLTDIEDNTNLSDPKYNVRNMKHYYPTAADYKDQITIPQQSMIVNQAASGLAIVFYIKIWKNFFLQHFWKPLPRNYILPNGKVMPANGFYDVITGKISTLGDSTGDTSLSIYDGTKLSLSSYVMFQDWSDFETTDVHEVKRPVSPAVQGYLKPTLLSDPVVNMKANYTHIPMVATTDDSEHGVDGLWYQSAAGHWFKADQLTYPLDTTDFTATNNLYVALKSTRNTATDIMGYVTQNLPQTAYQVPAAIKSEQVVKVDAIGTTRSRLFINGNIWIDKQYSSLATTDISKTYAVTQELNYYEYPIANAAYRQGKFLVGDRITVTKQLNTDNYWQYVPDKGWIDTENMVSEVL